MNFNAKLTPVMIEAMIIAETYTLLPSGLTMICELTIYNGFTEIGKSACGNRADFVEATGRAVSRAAAIRNVWPAAALLQQEQRYQESLAAAGFTKAPSEFTMQLEASFPAAAPKAHDEVSEAMDADRIHAYDKMLGVRGAHPEPIVIDVHNKTR